ncbi:OmpA/MotB family protein [Desulfosediminicola flagellatus]|uniref:OmpA/MotB family protein n=1 Tax=Desulfosediminicola flagellatus TaxID=2569541 RepID=UPI0010AC8386|nr:flagellar motor protein MotB [Desulfosediminicola flagellatus]
MAEDQTSQEETKCKPCKCAVGAPAWMVTYSDLVTLLLTFFVLLLSMASMDPVRFTEASSSLKDAFGMHAEPAHVEFAIPILPSPPITKFTPVQQAMTTKVYERVKSQLDLMQMNNEVDAVKKDSDTIILRVNDSILFKPGQAKVSPNSYPILRNIADIIRPLPMKLRIEGHTDDILISQNPIGNWDLSVSRAVSVMRFFKQGDLLKIDRMAATGYGPDRPLVPNRDDATRARNRRVEFVLRLDRLQQESDSPANRKGRVPL